MVARLAQCNAAPMKVIHLHCGSLTHGGRVGAIAHEQYVSVDGVQCDPVPVEDADEAGPDLNATLPDEEFPEVL